MPHLSHTVILDATDIYNSLCGADDVTFCDTPYMDDKNAGPNFLKAWREFRELTQSQLAEIVGTNQNMIAYLESGERALSAKWLRRLAPALNTQPGMLLDHDPETLDTDIIQIWAHIPDERRAEAKALLNVLARKTGTDD